MTDPNATSALALIPTGNRFDDEIKALAFEIWLFLANRNCAETHRQLLEEFRRPETPHNVTVPSLRQIQNWARKEQWDIRGNELVRQMAPNLAESQLSRLWVLTDKALDVAGDIINGRYLEHPRTGNVAVMSDMVKHLTQLRGLGTAGAVGVPKLEVSVTMEEQALDDLTADEKAEIYRNRILERKQMKKLTGANPRTKR